MFVFCSRLHMLLNGSVNLWTTVTAVAEVGFYACGYIFYFFLYHAKATAMSCRLHQSLKQDKLCCTARNPPPPLCCVCCETGHTGLAGVHFVPCQVGFVLLLKTQLCLHIFYRHLWLLLQKKGIFTFAAAVYLISSLLLQLVPVEGHRGHFSPDASEQKWETVRTAL